jgi:cytochrome c oxidase cbb3-type subunit III
MRVSNNENDDKVEIFDDEKSVILEHKYDGIHELNHPLPRWWVVLFIGTIVWSIPYYAHHMHIDGPTQAQELAIEMKVIEEKQKKFEATKVGFSEAEYKKIVADPKNAKLAKKLYKRKCKACHGAQGEGGIGPNLTDKFWINGKGSLADVYKILDEGVVDKGMAAWGPPLGKDKVMAILSYVMKFQGTSPKNVKAPQGKEYK